MNALEAVDIKTRRPLTITANVEEGLEVLYTPDGSRFTVRPLHADQSGPRCRLIFLKSPLHSWAYRNQPEGNWLDFDTKEAALDSVADAMGYRAWVVV